jgi:hypothetical protein
MIKDELKLALEALEEHHYGVAQIIIREALAQPEQEPVAKYIGEGFEGSLVQLYDDVKKGADFYTTPSPPQRTWVELTLTDREQLRYQFEDWNYPAILVDAISKKLKELNT